MKKIHSLLFWIIFILYMEIIFKLYIFKNIFNLDIFYIILFSFTIGLVCFIITNLAGKKINKIISIFVIYFFTILFISQIIYYKTFLSIFSIYSMGKAGQVFDFSDTILNIISRNILIIFLLLTPILYFTFFNKYIKYIQLNKKQLFTYIGIALISIFISLGSLILNSNDKYSPRELYYNIHSPTLSVNKLGLITTMRRDLMKIVFGFEERVSLNIDKGETKDNEKKASYNVINIDFDSLIKDETRPHIIEMHKYFKNKLPTKQNEYTGMFEGKSLIFILAESFHTIARDKDLTPTLYQLSNEGFIFHNFYAPLFPVSTTDGEYIAKTSLLPKEGVWSTYRSHENYLPFVLGNSFKNKGYKTNAYHNHTSTFYYRHLSHPNFGYDYYACGRGLDINCNRWPASDLEMIDTSYVDYINDSPFLTYYITVSGHLRYTRTGNSIVNQNWNYVKNLNYSDPIKSYIACHIELDKALGNLIKYLKGADILEDTVIALVTDHYPYGLTLNQMQERSSVKLDNQFTKHKSTFILWNSKIPKVEINKHVSSLDILPTLLNLFGAKYDSRILIGTDMLSDEEGLVIFSNRSFITDKGMYNSINSTFSSFDEDISDEYKYRVKKTVYDKFYLSRRILEDDYYKIIFNE